MKHLSKLMSVHPAAIGRLIVDASWRKILLLVSLTAVGIIIAVNTFSPRTLPNDLDGKLSRLQAARHYSEAEVLYEQLLVAKPLDLDLNYQYIGNHFEMVSRRSDDRIKAHYSDLSANSDSADVGYYGLGLIKVRQNEFKPGLDYYLQIKNSSQKYANNSIGRAYMELGEDQLAEPYFRKEILSDGFVAGAVFNLSELYARRYNLKGIRSLLEDERTAKFVSLFAQRRLSLLTGEFLNYLRLIFVTPMQYLHLNSLLIALLVCAMYFIYLWRVDIFEQEPIWSMALALLLGALAALISTFFSDLVALVSTLRPNSYWENDILYYVVHVGLVEETAKFLPVLLIVAFSRQVNEPVDFIIYGSLSALGFATLENSLYFSVYGIDIALGRFLVSTMVHMAMTSLVCFAWAYSRYSLSLNPALLVVGALVLAAMTHGIFDAFIKDNVPILSTLIAFFLAYAFRRMVQRCLKQSPFFEPTLMTSKHLHNFALMLSTAIVLLVSAFVYDNYNFSTEIANVNTSAFLISEALPAAVIFSVLGNFRLTSKAKPVR